jgi:8-oxo-dGTP pyrophosphatase MutT (NUDIX family)
LELGMASDEPRRPPLPAATVVVLRDAAAAPEILMLRRHERTAFMGGAFVFPGGRVDPLDEWPGGPEPPAGERPDPGQAADPAYRTAALRELFEEAGVLLARDRSSAFVTMTDPPQRERLERARREVHGGLLTLREVARREGLTLALDALVEWAWWVTPPLDTRRFDTRFFVARMPAGQTSEHDDNETIDSRWTTAAAALEADHRREIVLPPPTWMTLRELLPFATVEDVLIFAAARPIVRREPLVLQQNGTQCLYMPAAPPAEGHVPFLMVEGLWRPQMVEGIER